MLTVHCRGATLRLATASDDDLLVSLLPDDFEHDPTFPVKPELSVREHRDAWMRRWLHDFRCPPSPEDRHLVFVVDTGGEAVGLQTLEGEGFERSREVETTSFLVPAARGRRLGVAMRTAVLAVAFDVMGARRAVTTSRPDNVASKRVAERVGYTLVERRRSVGDSTPLDVYALTRQTWTRLAHLPVVIDGDIP